MTMTVDGYTNVMFDPERFDTYLVKTQEGCYDFAHFANGEWCKGNMTDGTVFLWAEIPQSKEVFDNFFD